MANESADRLSRRMRKYVSPSGDIDPYATDDDADDSDDTGTAKTYAATVAIDSDGTITITRSSR